jgi:hypothetical protein
LILHLTGKAPEDGARGKELTMIAFLFALAMTPSFTCPMTIGVGGDGTVYSGRFNGWYKVSSKTLDSDLRYGCYNDANPTPVTSVDLLLARGAPSARVDLVFSILKRDGWSREKVNVQQWDGKAPTRR